MSDQQYGQQPGQQGYYDPQTGQYIQQQTQPGYYNPQTGQYGQQQPQYSQQQGQYWQQPYSPQQQYAQPQETKSGLKALGVLVLLLGLALIVYFGVLLFVDANYKEFFRNVGESFDISTTFGLYTLFTILKVITFILSGFLFIGAGSFVLASAGDKQKLKTAKTFTVVAILVQILAFVFSLATLVISFIGKLSSWLGDEFTIWQALEGTSGRIYMIIDPLVPALLGLILLFVLNSKLKRAKQSESFAQQQYYNQQYYYPQGYGAQQYYQPSQQTGNFPPTDSNAQE